jgi:hypothetical protein
MQQPIIVFDHINKIVATVPTAPTSDRKLAAILAAAQDSQGSTASSGAPKQ